LPGISTILFTVLSLINQISAQANFTLSPALFSGKTYFRPTTQGPKYEHFAVCTAATTCAITNRAVDIWNSTSLNNAFPYSSSITTKVLFSGNPAQIADVTKLPAVQRPTTPPNISKCVWTHMTRWICQNGADNNWFLYNIVTEKLELTYSNTTSLLIQEITNGACTFVEPLNIILFCVTMGGTNKNKFMKIDDINGGGFPTYNGTYQFPNNTIGCDFKSGYLLTWSNTPVGVRIGKFETG
jgi:hypothetical protein